jgi:hypothetical protein
VAKDGTACIAFVVMLQFKTNGCKNILIAK